MIFNYQVPNFLIMIFHIFISLIFLLRLFDLKYELWLSQFTKQTFLVSLLFLSLGYVPSWEVLFPTQIFSPLTTVRGWGRAGRRRLLDCEDGGGRKVDVGTQCYSPASTGKLCFLLDCPSGQDTHSEQCARTELGSSLGMTICVEHRKQEGSGANFVISFRRKSVVQEAEAEKE